MASGSCFVSERQTIEGALPAWIKARPWSHGARVQTARILATLPIPGCSEARVAVVEDDRKRTYAVPLAFVTSSEHGIASVDGGFVVDALPLPEVGEALVAATRAGGSTEDAEYTLRFHTQRGADVGTGTWVAKVIHKLEPGESPELEVVRFLGAAGYRYVAPLAGWIDVVHGDAPPSTVAVIESFIPRKGTGLGQLDEELDRWFGEVLQMGDVDPPKLPPNDILSRALFPLPEDITVAVGEYVRDAALLGTRVGEMHKLLASTNVDAFAPERLDLAAREKLANEAKRAVGDAFAVLDVRGPSLPAAMQSMVSSLRAKMPSIEKRLMGVLSAPEGAVRIRVHGDLRLERILFTGDDYLVDGFEGDRERTLDDRKKKRSPLFDVASMLRSYHHIVTRALARQPVSKRPKLAPWAALFHRAASASFLGGWLRAASESNVLPAAPAATRALLDVFLIDQCAHDLQSEDELDVEIGLEGLREILETERKAGQVRTSRSFSPFVQSLRAVKVEPPVLEASAPELHAFKTGTATHAHRVLGAHRRSDGALDVAVWAPNAVQVAIVGDFNDWASEAGVLTALGDTGVYAGRVRGARIGQRYMFRIPGADDAPPHDKVDPFARACSPSGGKHASVIASADYAWGDQKWMQARRARRGEDRPIAILEVEIDAGYRDMALPLAARTKQLGFTHVALLFAHDGFFAPSAHYGTTEDLMFLVDTLHQDGIGVIFSWAPAEFALEPHGLVEFDGTPTFESDDSSNATHPVTGMGLFDMAKPEVRSFLLSSAVFWVEELHADGLRIDGLATAVYRDDKRAPGTWSPNAKGGRENLEGVELIQRITKVLKTTYPDVLLVADDSTTWRDLTRSAELGGLGFDLRCDATFIDDLRFHLGLEGKARENHDLPPVLARHNDVTSVDEASANLDLALRRVLVAVAWAQPGKKLLVANDDGETAPLVADLNRVYSQTAALHGDAIEAIPAGAADVLIFRRKHAESELVVVANLGNTERTDSALAAAAPGSWKVILDTQGGDEARIVDAAALSLAPRSVLFLVRA